MRTWYANQTLFARTGHILERLGAAGVPTLILKGAPIALLHYSDVGLRPMGDLDLLVPRDRVDQVIRIMADAGCLCARPHLLARARARWSSTSFLDGQGAVIDLHWNLLRRARHEAFDAELQAHAVAVRLGGTLTRTLAPTEHLLLICVHGSGEEGSSSIRWIADAWVLIHAADGAPDWDRLLEIAERRRFTYTLRHAFRFLRETMGASIPDHVLRHLERSRVSRNEIFEYTNARSRRTSLFCQVRLLWAEHARLTPEATGLRRLAGFFSHLQRALGALTVWRIPGQLFGLLATRYGPR